MPVVSGPALPFRTMGGIIALSLVVATLAGCSDDEPTASTASSTTVTTDAQPDTTALVDDTTALVDDTAALVDDTVAFCAVAAELEGERPEAYVGSAEHVADAEALAAVAPAAVVDHAIAYRDFLAGGGVDPGDPDSRQTTSWPAGIQTAVQELTDFVAATC
jgi:hypothetical protein